MAQKPHKKNLLRNGRVTKLLDEIEDEACESYNSIAEELASASFDEREGIEERLQYQDDTIKLVKSLRKYVPFIEAGAITMAEAMAMENKKHEE